MSYERMTPPEVALDHAVRMAMTIGTRSPVDIVAMAAIFLSFLDGEEIEQSDATLHALGSVQ